MVFDVDLHQSENCIQVLILILKYFLRHRFEHLQLAWKKRFLKSKDIYELHTDVTDNKNQIIMTRLQ